MNNQRPRFMWRAMTSVFIAAAFLLLLVSGAVLFISPPGRVANWTNWRMIGLTKHGWTGLHTWFGAVFILGAVFHLIFNIRPLLNYFRDRFTRRAGLRRESVVAVALCAVVFGGVQAGIPPFSTLLSWGENVKKGWENPRTIAPIPHAELLSLKELASQAKVPYETVVERLEAAGFKEIHPAAVAKDVAQANQVSSQRLYEIIQGQRAAVDHGSGKAGEPGARTEGGAGHGPGGGAGGYGGGGGGGVGRQTLAQYCSSKGIALTNAVARLQAKGIKFTPDRTLRDIAMDNGFERPYDLVSILENAK